MSDWTRKTRHAGPPARDRRKIDQDPPKVAPHKKPKEYELTVRWIATEIKEYTASFPSKVARDEFRRRVERELKEDRRRGHSFSLWQFAAERKDREIIGPEFEERYNGRVTNG